MFRTGDGWGLGLLLVWDLYDVIEGLCKNNFKNNQIINRKSEKISGAGSALEERYFGTFANFNSQFVCDTAARSLDNLQGIILHRKWI